MVRSTGLGAGPVRAQRCPHPRVLVPAMSAGCSSSMSSALPGSSRASNRSRTHPSPARRPWSRTPSRPTGARDAGVHGKAQILRGEHPLPQAHLQAGDDSTLGARRPATTLSCDAQPTPPSPPGSWPASAGWLRSPRPGRATPIPPSHLTFGPSRPRPDPGLYYDLCGLMPGQPPPHSGSRRRGDTTAQPTPGQISPDRNDQSRRRCCAAPGPALPAIGSPLGAPAPSPRRAVPVINQLKRHTPWLATARSRLPRLRRSSSRAAVSRPCLRTTPRPGGQATRGR